MVNDRGGIDREVRERCRPDGSSSLLARSSAAKLCRARKACPHPPQADEGRSLLPPASDGFKHEYATITQARGGGEGALPSPSAREGPGPPLLLVHGWPGFYYEWHLNIGPLSQHLEVVVPDMRGYAYTDKPDLPPEAG